jgi:SAM-dependent methyltransferase
MRRKMNSAFYRDDLAHVHHSGFTELAEHAALYLHRALLKRGIRDGTVVDLGCGTGELARAISERGFDVLGVDVSAAMIRRARRVAPRARFRVSTLADFDLPRCEAVTAVGEVLSYLPPSTKPAPTGRFFLRVARALRPGGIFFFDALVTGAPAMEYRLWKCSDEWAVLVNVSEDVRRRRLRRDITTFVRKGAHYRRSSETHELLVFRARALIRDLEHAGFRVRTTRRFGKTLLGARRLGFIARKSNGPGSRRN